MKALKEIRTAITQAFQKRFSREFARVCFFEALDWQLHPEFACDLGALRVLWKACVQVPGWLGFMRPASGGKYSSPSEYDEIMRAYSEAPDVLRRLGWTMDFAGFELQRRDRAGRLRVARPGFDGFQVVFQWLRQRYRQTMVAQTGRVNHRYHRDDPSLAAGLDLPAPSMDADYRFDGLLSAINMGLRATDRAAIGGGHSCWFYNAHGDFPEDHARWLCLCGRSRPSHVHLLWCCPCTAHLRATLRLPRDRCEERLLLQGVPEQPPPPAIDPGDFHDTLVQALSVQLRLDPAVLYLATDGSEHLEVGSYAVAVHPGGFTCATGNGDEDQSSFKQELLGFDCAASALAEAVRDTGWTGRVVFALDSQSALRVVLRQDCRFCFLMRVVARTRASLLELAAMQVQLTYVWVPSHGKRPQWQPPSGLCADRLRWLNDRADRAAADCRHRRSGGRGRAEWWRLREVAGAWELGATQALASAGQLLHAELRRHGIQPRELPPSAAAAEAHGDPSPPADGAQAHGGPAAEAAMPVGPPDASAERLRASFILT